MKAIEIINRLNELSITQKTFDWIESLPDDVYKETFMQIPIREITTVGVSEHRWYENGIIVYEFEEYKGTFFGVNCVTKAYSENSDAEDFCHTLVFYEMEEIPAVTYQIKM